MTISSNAYHTRGSIIRVDGLVIPGVQDITGLQSGSNSEIDVTTLSSQAREYTVGLPDSGTLSISGIARPQHPVSIKLDEAKVNSEELVIDIIQGAVPANARETDGTGVVLKENVAVSSALGSSSLSFSVASNVVPSVSEGDWISTTNDDYQIVRIDVAGSMTTFGTNGTSADSAAVATFIRPAIKWSMRARVMKFETSLASDEVTRYSADFRPTGRIITEVGTPDVTI